MIVPSIRTERLLLREQRPSDTEVLVAAYADDSFARYIVPQRRGLDREQAWRALSLVAGSWALNGFGMWVVEELETGTVAGRVGPWDPAGWPGFEIGWAIVPDHQGKGYATEAAAAAMVWAHNELGRDEMIHLIDPGNGPSEAVARRLGATFTGRHEFSNDLVVNIWTSRWDAFVESEPYRRHIAAANATA